MNRVLEYGRFAVSFIGVGYLALWPLMAHDGTASTVSLICDGLARDAALCHASDGLRLSPGLDLMGQAAALCMAARLMLRLPRRLRRRAARAKALSVATLPPKRIDSVLRRFGAPRSPPPRRYVAPRRDFGLRGVPR